MKDQGFPLISYERGKGHSEWGRAHGEEFREGIKDLVRIRTELMLSKAPALRNHLGPLADAQFAATQKLSPEIAEEIMGIAEGAGCSLGDIVILNNYTDFRDIQLPEEGCSTVHVQRGEQSWGGQTWDMHGSAKNYVCVIDVPSHDNMPATVVFSLVGCVGMMGYNSRNLLIGVNNINTRNAVAGVIWPALVRKALMAHDIAQMELVVNDAYVTSGHNYIIAGAAGGRHWEITPSIKECVLSLNKGDNGMIFHTNHCLGDKVREDEQTEFLSTTTFSRYKLLEKKAESIQSYKNFVALLKDHEEYPKSICSHFESGAQDPSMTCGGGACDFNNKDILIWRGCEVHDNNYKEYRFKIADGEKIVLCQ